MKRVISIEKNETFLTKIKIDNNIINISYFFDKYLKSNRYSYEVIFSRNSGKGTHASGGYGNDNEIIFKTFDSAYNEALSILFNNDKSLIREFKLNKILNEK